MSKLIAIILTLFILQSLSFATTHWLGTNKFTKQYSWFYSEDEFFSYEPIGWEYHGENLSVIDSVTKLGYTETNFHYTFDLIIIVLILIISISSVLLFVYKFKRKRI